MSILQIVLISIYFIFAQSTLPFGSMGTWATIDRPLVAGLVVGLILGNPVQGTIIGASIIEKGTTNGTITDIDGNFSLSVSSSKAIS